MSSRKALIVARTVAIAVAALSAAAPARGATESVEVSATLRSVISLNVFQDLGFGDITVGQGATGSIALQPNGTLVFSGSGLAVGGSTPPQPGQVDIVGQAGAPIDVSCNSALLANLLNETIPVSINVAAAVDGAVSACEGLETPVMTVTQPADSFSIFVGGLIDSDDLAQITSFEDFSSSLNAGIHAVFQAVYQ